MTSGQVTRATDDAEDSSAAKLKGKRITGTSGNEIGKIHDFIIDGSSGQIAHIVVSTGGFLGIGDKLRLVQRESVKQSGSEFSIDMQESEFKALPTISSADLDAGRFTAQRQVTQAASTSTQSDTATTQSQGQLVRASQLEDKSLRSDNTEVGDVEHIIIDFQSGKAMALVDANAGFVTSGGKFLVPFNKLEVRSGEADSITTSLLRSDFPMQQASSATAATSTSDSLASTSPASSTAATPVTSDTTDTATTTTPSATTASSSSTPATSTPSATTATAGATSGISSGTSSYDASRTSGTTTTSPSTSTATTSDPSYSTTDRSRSASSADTASSSSATSPSTSTSSTLAGRSTETPDSSSSDLASSRTRTDTSVSATDTASTDRSSPATADTANTAGVSATGAQSTEQELTPTGQTSADQSPASGATAMAIRRAIDSDSTLAQEDVQVTTKVVLRGSVESEDAKKRVEEMAKKAAGSAEIDNQITVKQK